MSSSRILPLPVPSQNGLPPSSPTLSVVHTKLTVTAFRLTMLFRSWRSAFYLGFPVSSSVIIQDPHTISLRFLSAKLLEGSMVTLSLNV